MKQLFDWQERVVTERDILTRKIESLQEFLRKGEFKNVNPAEVALLNAQYQVMLTYANILTKRIESWETKQ